MTVPVGVDRQHRPSSAVQTEHAGVSDIENALSQDSGKRKSYASNLQELVLLAFGIALTFTICYTFGRGRIFWEDEMLGWMLLHDPHWHHMIRAWKLGADGGGFSFYLTGRAWFFLFGSSEVSFRMYSAACFAAAFAVVWTVVRRFYSPGPAAFALYNTFFFSPPLVLHMAEGRFYGLLMLSTALAVWVATLPPTSPRIGPRALLGLTFLVHALLITSHLLGIVYSLSLVVAMVAIDWSDHQLRPQLYLAAVASWFLLLPERAAIFASADVGKPFFWTTQPTLRRFIGAYSAFSAEIAVVLFGLALAVGFTLWSDRRATTERFRSAYKARRPIYVVTLVLLLVPLAFLFEGFFGPSLFISRYLLPVSIAQVTLTAEAATLIPWTTLTPSLLHNGASWCRSVRAFAITSFVAALLLWVFSYLRPLAIGQPNYTDALSAMLPKGIPVLCEDAWSFTEIIGRQHASGVQYTYLLDWPQSLSPSAPRLEVTQYHLMHNWREAGYFSSSIVNRETFLQNHRQFLVLHTIVPSAPSAPPEIGNPLVDRFRQDPAYTVQPYASLDRNTFVETAWRVCKGPCPS